MKKEILLTLAEDAPLAHEILFDHRHADPAPPFHDLYRSSFFGPDPKLLYWFFRGAAKSSISEEALVLGAIHRRFNNCVIVGASSDRANERLVAVRHEFEHNEKLVSLYGDMSGDTWTDSKLVLSNGVCLQALGQGQDLRGMKHLQHRPDFALLDDLERREDAWSPTSRARMKQWFFGEFFPALDPNALIRMNATPMDPESLTVVFSKLPGWRTITVPIRSKDPNTGAWLPSWPERFPLPKIEELEASYLEAGMSDAFAREYMVTPVSEESRVFRPEHFRFADVSRGFLPVYAAYDPARTVKATSAHTGKVVYSWQGPRLIIWESGGHLWQPDEIVADIFDVNNRFEPVFVAVEKDGLEEFILQPLRQESLRRNVMLPLEDVRAPRGKLDFIKALQPFFKAGEIIFAGLENSHKTLIQQLENFPTGRIDVPNALAYALRLRPGAPVFDDFDPQAHVDPDLSPAPRDSFFLVVNATQTQLAAALCQFSQGSLRIFRDFVYEGDPGLCLPFAVQDASLFAGAPLRLVAPRSHFSTFDIIGLRPAARSIPAELHRGGDLLPGRDAVRRLLRSRVKALPAVRVSPDASATIRAFSAGYCFPVNKSGELEEPVSNVYSLLLNGVECLASLPSASLSPSAEAEGAWAYTPEGRRYRSARG